MELSIFSGIGFLQHLKTEVVGAVNSIKEMASQANVANGVYFIAVLILALIAGFFGYRLIKVLSALVLAGIGFTLGGAIFDFLLLQPGMESLPGILTYVLSAVLAVAFFFAGYKKYNVVVCLMAYLVGSSFVWNFTGDSTMALGIGLIFAVLFAIIVRISVVVLTSFMGGFLTVACIGQFFPDLALLKFSETNDIALIIALVLSVLFMVLQFVFARFYKAE